MGQHHLEGVRHETTLDGARVVTTWTTKRGAATRAAEALRSEGAVLSRVFSDGRAGYRVVGYWRWA